MVFYPTKRADNEHQPVRWGFVHIGATTNDFCCAIRTLSDLEHELVAVAVADDGDLGKAREFAELHRIRKTYGDYAELADDSDVEVVYVATPGPHHVAVARSMLEKGKSVVVQNPLYSSGKEARELIMYAERKKRFLMEAAYVTRFFPSLEYVQRLLRMEALGEVTNVNISMGSGNPAIVGVERSEQVIRMAAFAVQLLIWIYDLPPTLKKATFTADELGIKVGMNAEFSYGKDTKAKIQISTLAPAQSDDATIIGSLGQITIKNFARPTTLIDINDQEKCWPLPKIVTELPWSSPLETGLQYQVAEIRRCLRNRLVQSDFFKHNDSIMIQKATEAINAALHAN